jgi:DNA-binding transcriptional LysR family regulator
MNFKQFETLYWVARLGGFRAAGRQLRMTQPAVSARIRELEAELGIQLFDRSRRSAVLTAKRHELLAYAERIGALSAEIQQLVGSQESIAGRVRMGVTSIPARTWLPQLVARLRRAYPSIALEVTVESSEHMRDLLMAGELDVAFLAGPFHSPRMTTDLIGEVSMSFLASPSMGLKSSPIAPRELAEWPIITGPRGSHLHDLAHEWFRQGGEQPRLNHACSSLTTRILLAVEGVGFAVAPASAAVREIAEGKLRVVATTVPLPSLAYIVATPDATQSPAVGLSVTLAKQLIAEKPDIQFYYSAGRALG